MQCNISTYYKISIIFIQCKIKNSLLVDLKILHKKLALCRRGIGASTSIRIVN